MFHGGITGAADSLLLCFPSQDTYQAVDTDDDCLSNSGDFNSTEFYDGKVEVKHKLLLIFFYE